MSLNSRTFRVFVSSTFADLVEERNALQRKVWPELANLCEGAGFRFQAIDLRWGISEEAGLDQRTARICLQELARCQATTPRPNFVILLGNRYGWRPLPEAIEAAEFEAIETKAAELNLPHRSLLRGWYRRDENAVPPAFSLRRRSSDRDGDYTRPDVWTRRVETPLRTMLATCAAAIPLPEGDRIKYERSLTEQEILAGALNPAVADAQEHVFAYFREVEAFDQVESPPDDDATTPWRFIEFVRAAFRRPRRLPPEAAILRRFVDFADASRPDREARRLQRNLKARLVAELGPDHVRKYSATWTNGSVSLAHLDALCADVLADLTAVIQAEIARFTASDSLDIEVAAHRQFGELRGGKGRFRGRADLLARIASYLGAAEPSRPLVISGPAGTGKSAVIARAVEDARDRFPQAVVLGRFIGATPASVDGRSLLQSLCDELGRWFRSDAVVPPEDRELVGAFRERLAWATAARPVLVFLDAVDQLAEADNAQALAWLPRQLPPHVRLVVSVLDDPTPFPPETSDATSPAADSTAILRRRAMPEDWLALADYPRGDAAVLLDSWLRADRRTLTTTQAELILAAFERCPRPLFLKLAAEEGKQWRSDEPTPTMPMADSPDATLAAIIDRLFDRLAASSNHGKLLVERSLGYLVAAKHGLTEDELIGLLSTDREFFDAFLVRAEDIGQPLPAGVGALPVAVWVRLHADLQPYLTTRRADGTTLIAFYHRSLERAARERFLGTPEVASRRHQHLARFFTPNEPSGFFRLNLEEQRTWAARLPPETRPVNLRMVTELPHQLLEVAKLLGNDDARSPHWDAVVDLLLNIHFLEAKAEGGAVIHDLLALLRAALGEMPKGAYRSSRKRIEVLAEAIERDRSFLDDHPTCLFQSLWNSCYWYDSREARDRYWTLAHGMDLWEMASLFSESLAALVEDWKASPIHRVRPWLRAISPPQHRLRSHLASQQKMPWRFSTRLVCSPDGDWLAWNGLQYSPNREWLCIWDRRGNTLERILVSGGIYDLAIAGSGRVLAAARAGVVDLYHLQEGEFVTGPFMTIDPESEKAVSRVAFADDSDLLAVGTFAGELLIYAPDEPEKPLRVRGQGAKITALAWQNSEALFVGHNDGTVVRVDPLAGTTVALQGQVDGPINDLLVLTDGTLLAASGHDMPSMGRGSDLDQPEFAPAIHSWDSSTGVPGASLTEHKSQVNSLCRRAGRREYFSAAGSGFPLWNRENAIYRWSEGSTYPSDRFAHLANAVEDLCYIESEQVLFSMSNEGLLQEWRFGSGCEGDFRCRWHDGDIAFIRFSPCGRYFATACQRDDPLIGRVRDGSCIARLGGCEQSLFSMAFFHDGRSVLTAPAEPDRTSRESYFVRLWDVQSGERLGQTGPHDRGVYTVAVSADDRFILTGTGDYNFRGRNIQSVYLWDARTLRLVDRCGGHAWSNADRVSDSEVERMLHANGVRMPPRRPPVWTAERVSEAATVVMKARTTQEDPSARPPLGWLPTVPTNAETPYAWHPLEPIVAIATGPFLQLFRVENGPEVRSSE